MPILKAWHDIHSESLGYPPSEEGRRIAQRTKGFNPCTRILDTELDPSLESPLTRSAHLHTVGHEREFQDRVD